ncbi:alpha/beta-hydrolase [Sarocladium strictum]
MASHPPADCCVVGVKHEGSPTGKPVRVAGRWDAYYSSPSGAEAHHDVVLIYLPDILGIWQNSQLMADQFAMNGYHTLVIDLYNGDALPLNKPAGFDMKKWMMEGSDGKNPHTPEAVDPIVEAAIKYLKAEHGVARIGAVGYCFGGKYVVRHYKSGIDVGFIAHPTNITEAELAEISGPLSIAAAETDPLFPAEKRHASERILAESSQPYQVTLYSGVSHGFAVRGDITNRRQVFAKKQAFSQAVVWFNEYLVGGSPIDQATNS